MDSLDVLWGNSEPKSFDNFAKHEPEDRFNERRGAEQKNVLIVDPDSAFEDTQASSVRDEKKVTDRLCEDVLNLLVDELSHGKL